MDAVARAVETAPPPVPGLEGDSGTITIVFSDIESSTQRATSMGDAAWMKVLSAHNDIIKRHVDEWQGTVVKNQGDGFMLTFGGARRALRAMIGVQQDLQQFAEDNPGQGVRVRVGVHTGEVIAEDGDIFGKHVMLAARVGGIAEGGQILVSSLVQEIAGGPRRPDLRRTRGRRPQGHRGRPHRVPAPVGGVRRRRLSGRRYSPRRRRAASLARRRGSTATCSPDSVLDVRRRALAELALPRG